MEISIKIGKDEEKDTAEMGNPYRIQQHGEGWAVMHKKGDKWSIKSHHATRERALSAMRLLYHIEGGGKLTRQSDFVKTGMKK
ncbi:MAG: hypothetical protein QME51_01730 [Planctomycetota bacterium]|nr:hypothetical protein [Planctomycetota bacterium]